MTRPELEWENMRVRQTMLGYEDHGILSSSLMFEASSSGQGFGGRCLGNPECFKNWVCGVLAVFGFDEWERIAGNLARVGREKPYGLIVAIRPIIESYPVFWPDGDLDKNPGLYGDNWEPWKKR